MYWIYWIIVTYYIMGMIKYAHLNCNKTLNQTINDESINLTQFRSYPNRFAVTFPKDWNVDEITNSDKSILTVTASKEGHFMSIIEQDPTLTDFNYKSIYEIDKEDILYDYREKYSDFKLLDFEKKKIIHCSKKFANNTELSRMFELTKENIDKMMNFQLFKYESYCKTCTEWVQPKGHFPMRKYAKLLTESERLQDDLEPIDD